MQLQGKGSETRLRSPSLLPVCLWTSCFPLLPPSALFFPAPGWRDWGHTWGTSSGLGSASGRSLPHLSERLVATYKVPPKMLWLKRLVCLSIVRTGPSGVSHLCSRIDRTPARCLEHGWDGTRGCPVGIFGSHFEPTRLLSP